MKNKGYAKFREGAGGWANKVYYGRCANGDRFSLIKKVQEIIHVTLTVSMQSCQWEMRTGLS